jgi:hypothetical protein
LKARRRSSERSSESAPFHASRRTAPLVRMSSLCGTTGRGRADERTLAHDSGRPRTSGCAQH